MPNDYPCFVCYRKGKVACDQCSGRGWFTKADGLMDVIKIVIGTNTVREKCSYCNGTGQEPCPGCNGTGRTARLGIN